MPELPEVEIVRQGLEKYIPGKRLREVRIISPSSVIINGKRCENREEAETLFAKAFVGLKVLSLDRLGKLLFISFGEKKLAIHLKMTGQIVVYKAGDEVPDKYTRAILTFDDVSICFNDKRRFGYIEILLGKESYKRKLSLLGVDALSPKFTKRYLKECMERRKIAVKKFLLDQKAVAGIGNAYADEILFLSKISPFRPVNQLSAEEIEKIWEATTKVLESGIKKGGLTIRDFVSVTGESGDFQNHLQVYKKAGELCPDCGSVIVREKVGTRSSYYCPRCQK